MATGSLRNLHPQLPWKLAFINTMAASIIMTHPCYSLSETTSIPKSHANRQTQLLAPNAVSIPCSHSSIPLTHLHVWPPTSMMTSSHHSPVYWQTEQPSTAAMTTSIPCKLTASIHHSHCNLQPRQPASTAAMAASIYRAVIDSSRFHQY